MKNYLNLSSIFIFLLGALVAFAFVFIRKNESSHAYLSRNENTIKQDPYKFDEKTKAALSYFFTSLPDVVQLEIKKRDSDFDYLASCKGDLVPGIDKSFVVSYINKNKSKVLVFAVAGTSLIKESFDLSDLIGFKQKNENDYLEVQCRHAAFILNNPRFQPIAKEKELASACQKSNHSIIQARSRQSGSYGIFAYNPDDRKFHLIGTSSVENR